jgi:hypothetical protein
LTIFDVLRFYPQMKGKVVPSMLAQAPALTAVDVLPPGALAGLQGEAFLAQLPTFLCAALAGSNSGGKAKAKVKAMVACGKPQVVVVSAAALRCCALVPAARKLNKLRGDASGGFVAKLFAKHQKVIHGAPCVS